MLRVALGRRWDALHPHIRARFAVGEGETRAEYTGSMRRVECSRLGRLMARLIRYARILPHRNARDVPFRFEVKPLAQRLGWLKLREYRFDDELFSFQSCMTLDEDTGDLLERFGGGLGMRVRLEVVANRLIFVDNGYFLHFGRWRLPLPRRFGPGRFLLVHRDLDADHFDVTIDVVHPWFGVLFHQEGQFVREQ